MLFVFDTNVIISAALLTNSVPALALSKAEQTGLILYSEDTLQELIRVLERPKLSPYIEAKSIGELYSRIRMNWHYVAIMQKVNDCRDDKDNKFLELALCGDADILVSGDKDLLVMNQYRKTAIITPSDFLYK